MLSSLSSQLSAPLNDPSFEGIWQEICWRGLVQVSTDEERLEAALEGTPLAFYCGFDPTAPSLHLGNLVQLLLMRRLQLAGHFPLALVGGSTGLIGDPRPSAERTLNSRETVAEWVGYLTKQIGRFLSFEGKNPALMVNNLDWTASVSAIDFLRDIGRHFRVGTMLRKDAVAARLNSAAGISYTEFSYQILQGFDFLQLYRQHNCVLQTGGSDQWGNLTSGTDLIHRTEHARVHAIGTPLITNSDGTKFGKSEGNAIWLDAELSSPYAFYQFWLNTDDADVIDRLKVFTFLTREQINAVAHLVRDEPFNRAAQRILAYQVTAIVHGEEATDAVVAASAALFGRGELNQLPRHTLLQALAELTTVQSSASALIGAVLVEAGLCSSLSDARRAVAQGGVYANNQPVTSETATVAELAGDSEIIVLRRGKKTLAGVHITDAHRGANDGA